MPFFAAIDNKNRGPDGNEIMLLTWTQQGAENRLALTCMHASGRLSEFWKHRLNDRAARNNPQVFSA
jgi:hypothetical protein